MTASTKSNPAPEPVAAGEAKPQSAGSLALKKARMVVVAVIGSTVVLLGVAMLPLPGPGMLVIIAGLALLASEFVWAARLLKRVKDMGSKAGTKVFNTFNGAWWRWFWPWGKNGNAGAKKEEAPKLAPWDEHPLV